jgi:hypothetical protein
MDLTNLDDEKQTGNGVSIPPLQRNNHHTMKEDDDDDDDRMRMRTRTIR